MEHNYTYPFEDFLIKDISQMHNLNEYRNIYISAYYVNTSGKFPFLQFLLMKAQNYSLTFPTLTSFYELHPETLAKYSIVYLSGLLNILDFETFSNNIQYNGVCECNDDLYIFFNMTNCEIVIDDVYSFSNVRFAIMDEMINCKHVCNIPVSNDTTDFFIQNDRSIYLCNSDNGEEYEIPSVGYVGKPSLEKMNFTLMFGETAKNKSAILGPYFYFTSFKNSAKQITDVKGGGIVRFALFTGSTKYIENNPDDAVDESDIKKERLHDENLDAKYEVLTMRISDHDGKWAENYDSVYLGNIELDDGSDLEETQLLVLKECNQQVPLSYHFISQSNLVKNNTYYIK